MTMNANDVIESYVTEVAVKLPRKQRNDVAFELRALINEELQGRAEAAGRGIPVLTAPLPAARALLGDHARFLSPDAPADWAAAVAELAARPAISLKPLEIPTWCGHFRLIEQAIMSRQNNPTA